MCVCVCVCVCVSVLSHIQLFVTPWTAACQASLSMEFSRRRYKNGFHSPGDLPDPGIEPGSPVLQVDSYHLSHPFPIPSPCLESAIGTLLSPSLGQCSLLLLRIMMEFGTPASPCIRTQMISWEVGDGVFWSRSVSFKIACISLPVKPLIYNISMY